MYNVLIYGREFREVSYDALAGMFIAADLAGVTDPLIMIRDTTDTNSSTGSYQMVSRVVPTGAYLMLECSHVDILTSLRGAKSPRGVLAAKVASFIPLLHNITIVGERGTQSILLVTFDNEAILQGIIAFFMAYNQYPTNMVVLRGTSASTQMCDVEWQIYTMPISISVQGTDTYVAPTHISIHANMIHYSDAIMLTSTSPLGWKRRDLFATLATKVSLQPGMTITGLNATSPGIYTVAVRYTPSTHPASLGESDVSVVPLTAL